MDIIYFERLFFSTNLPPVWKEWPGFTIPRRRGIWSRVNKIAGRVRYHCAKQHTEGRCQWYTLYIDNKLTITNLCTLPWYQEIYYRLQLSFSIVLLQQDQGKTYPFECKSHRSQATSKTPLQLPSNFTCPTFLYQYFT